VIFFSSSAHASDHFHASISNRADFN